MGNVRMDTAPLEETLESLPLKIHSAKGELVRPDTVGETSHLREYSEPAVGVPLAVMAKVSTLEGTVGSGSVSIDILVHSNTGLSVWVYNLFWELGRWTHHLWKG